MDMKQIKELIAQMEKAGLSKIRLKGEDGSEVEIDRQVAPAAHAAPPPPPPRQEAQHHFTPPHPHKEEAPAAPGETVTSPMVGTFYSAPSPDDPAYIKVGDEVDENTVVCIIEAMKVMNEVKAGKKGKIVEILVNNADPVEFGTNLFRIV